MRIANLAGRLVVLDEPLALDVERASAGRFDSDPQSVYDRWDEFVAWASNLDWSSATTYDHEDLGAPVPRPGQVFAVGLNYAGHAAESGFATPTEPAVFTKFVSSITGPYAEVGLPTDTVDWEVELVAVIGRRAYRVSEADAWDYVAGLTVGQDLSERARQLVPPAPQFSLGKSFPGFAPTGPVVVTPDELGNGDDLEIGCSIDGELVQKARTSDLIFTVPQLVERLSAVLPLSPGDLIFTGTPSGVGHAQSPPRYLVEGNELVSWVEGVGEIRTTFTRGPHHVTIQ